MYCQVPVGIPSAFYFCLINCVMNSKTIWSQNGKKEKKEFLSVLFVKYLQAVYLWPTSFQRICSRYSSKRIKIFCFVFVLIWSTHNNLLPHVRITYYIILDKNCNSLTKATVSSRKLRICVFILCGICRFSFSFAPFPFLFSSFSPVFLIELHNNVRLGCDFHWQQ